jgi:hypothetical protein
MKFTPKHSKCSFQEIEISKITLSHTTIYFNNDIEFKIELPNYIKNGDLEKELQREFNIMWINFVIKTRVGHDGKRLKKKLLELIE